MAQQVFFAMLGCLAIVITSFVFVEIGWSSGVKGRGWLRSETGAKMKFRRPLLQRVGTAGIGLFLLGFASLPFLQSPSSHHQPTANGNTPFAGFLAVATFGLLALLMFSLCGPNDLDLDYARRTYRWRWGAPWRPHVRNGTWDDLSGIYVQKQPKAKDKYFVGMRWKGTWRACDLGRFTGRANAERFAGEVAGKLHLPRVEPPPQPQLRDVFSGS